MRVTREIEDIFWEKLPNPPRVGHVTEALQAVLDHLFPEPGTNPLAVMAPDRDTVALRRLRNVLIQADHSETAIRGGQVSGLSDVYGTIDQESEEILRVVRSVREALTPWASRGWESLNAGR